jgi:hypothetical protein
LLFFFEEKREYRFISICIAATNKRTGPWCSIERNTNK